MQIKPSDGAWNDRRSTLKVDVVDSDRCCPIDECESLTSSAKVSCNRSVSASSSARSVGTISEVKQIGKVRIPDNFLSLIGVHTVQWLGECALFATPMRWCRPAAT